MSHTNLTLPPGYTLTSIMRGDGRKWMVIEDATGKYVVQGQPNEQTAIKRANERIPNSLRPDQP